MYSWRIGSVLKLLVSRYLDSLKRDSRALTVYKPDTLSDGQSGPASKVSVLERVDCLRDDEAHCLLLRGFLFSHFGRIMNAIGW